MLRPVPACLFPHQPRGVTLRSNGAARAVPSEPATEGPDGREEAIVMGTDHDVAAARRAARELSSAVESLRRHYGDTVDVRRLHADAERIHHDLELLAGPEPVPAGAPLEIIPDGDYPPEFWQDAGDEGVGRR